MKYIIRYGPAAGLILLSVALAGYFIYSATFRSLTTLEGTLLQFFVLVAGLAGSWLVGRQSGLNRTHVRSAFRRITSLYSGLSRAAAIIEESREFDTVEDYRVAIARLEELVRGQLITADDAMKDWRDVVSEDTSDGLEGPFSLNTAQYK